MKNSYLIWVKIKTNSYYNLLIKLNDIGINIYDNKKYSNYVLIKVNYSDYKKIKKYLVSYKSSIDSYVGIPRIKNMIKKYFVFIISNVIGIALLLFVNNLIFKVEIRSPDQKIQKLVLNELKKYNLGKMKLKKNHYKIESIVSKILDDNKKELEWLEIKYDGLFMIVNVVEKSKEKTTLENNYCDILSKTDAKISSLNIYRGVPLKEINDYVYKDEVIISGNIMHNEEVKNKVCASGIVYGEVWYNIKIKIPLEEEYIEYTNRNRYNLGIVNNKNNYLVFKSRLKTKEEERINLYKLNNFEINLVKEKEYVIKTRKLTSEEAFNKAIDKGIATIKLKLNKNEEILLQKVLKKKINDSTIYLELFVVTKEEIGYTKALEEELISDEKSST